jgi:hypothetical protein
MYIAGGGVVADLATAQGISWLGVAAHALTLVQWVLAVKQQADPRGPSWKLHRQDSTYATTLLEAIRTTLCDSPLQGEHRCYGHNFVSLISQKGTY